MEQAKESLSQVIERINTIVKAQAVFVTNIAGKDVDWEISFQFNLNNEDPFFLEIKNHKILLSKGTKSDAIVVLTGNSDAIVKICEGKGDFTHAISREHITVEKGKVMDVIRLTRAITIAIKSK